MVSEDTNNHASSSESPPTAPERVMLILAGISVLIGLVAALIVSTSWLGVVISITGSFFLTGVLWTLWCLCRRGHQQDETSQEVISAMARLAGEFRSMRHAGRGTSVSSAEKVSDTSQADRTKAILVQLRELNANLMMTDAQRRKKAQDLSGRDSQRLKQRVEEALSTGDLCEAEGFLDSLTDVEPDSPDIQTFRERIEHLRTEAESIDAVEAARQVENLMAASDFTGALAVAESLLGRYPDSVPASDMLERITREHKAFVSEHRGRMYHRIEEDASKRHWYSALAEARKFLDLYPDSTEADTVRVQLSTITDNARIQEVRDLRDQIRDLITRRRFTEAVDVAVDVIERFPETTAATELRKQMPRLQERAKSEEK